MTATGGCCIHGTVYAPGWSCPQCSAAMATPVCHQCGWPSGTHAKTCSSINARLADAEDDISAIQVVFGKWAALASAETENDRLRGMLDAANARLAEAEATIARLQRQLEAAEADLAEADRESLRLEWIVLLARRVSQWHNAMNSGPLEVLDAELGELYAATHPEEADR